MAQFLDRANIADIVKYETRSGHSIGTLHMTLIHYKRKGKGHALISQTITYRAKANITIAII